MSTNLCLLHALHAFYWNPQVNNTLRGLDLSWNSIRMASGVSLGKSLARNSALIELRLAHNSLAEPGIQAVSCYFPMSRYRLSA